MVSLNKDWAFCCRYCLQADLAASKSNLLDLSLNYDTTTKVTTFEDGSRNYLFLIDILTPAITTATGIRIPTTTSPQFDVVTAAVKASISDSKRLQYLNVELGGVLSLGGLAKRLGFQWTLPDDLFTIANPKLEYDAEGPSLGVDMVVGIPAAKISNAQATLFLSSTEVNLQVGGLGWVGLSR